MSMMIRSRHNRTRHNRSRDTDHHMRGSPLRQPRCDGLLLVLCI